MMAQPHACDCTFPCRLRDISGWSPHRLLAMLDWTRDASAVNALQKFISLTVSKRFVTLWSIAFALIFFGFATKAAFDPHTIGSFWPGHFFSAQADALLHGRLWVAKKYLPGECFFVEGHCYGYFGLVPSIARIPLVMALGVEQSEMTAVFLSIGAGISIWAALDLCRRVLHRESPVNDQLAAGFMGVAAIVLGPGSVLMLVSDAYVYQEAIMWSIAGMMVAVNLFWRWWTEGKDRQYIGAVIALVVAAGSRPTAAAVGVILAGGLVLVRFMRGRLGWRTLAGALILGLLPILAMVGVWSVKFGTPTPSWDSYEGRDFEFVQYNIAQNDGQLGNSARFVPTAALAFFRPDSLRLQSDWPFIRFRFGRPYGRNQLERITYLPPANRDSINVEPIVSVTDVAPIPLIATAMGAIAIALRRRQRFELLVLLALTSPIIIMATSPTIATRYLGDFYPLLAVGTAFSATLVPRLRRSSWNVRTVVTAVVVALTIISVPIATALAAQYNWTYLYGIN